MQDKSKKTPSARRQPPKRSTLGHRWFFTPTVLISAVLVLVVGVVIYAIWQTVTAKNASNSPLAGVETFRPAGGHQEGALTYEQTPPVGGIHNAVWQNCGVYTTPIANENGVHSLEHGAIWITYQPDLPSEQVAELQTLTRQSGYRLLSPYPGIPSPIVASAWGYQLKLDKSDDSQLLSFIQRYEQNPQGPEPGATCSGGIGRPE